MKKEYRYDLSGLKALAIIAVVLYHFFDLTNNALLTNNKTFSGGFLGVDVFLVISGFLITSGIVFKLESNSFNLKQFYIRRFSRILPPLVVVCTCSLLIGYFILLPSIYLETAVEAANALVFIGNFRFANSGGYFSLNACDKVLLHTWYICITIQFYLLIPLFLCLFNKVLGTSKIKFGVLALFLIFLVVSLVVSKNGKGYLLTQTRIWELFLGCYLYFYKDAFTKINFNKKDFVAVCLEIVGTAIIIYSIFNVRLDNGIWLVSTSALTVIGTSIVVLTNNQHSIFKNKLISKIGDTSYSLYLWHWPIFVFAIKFEYKISVLSSLALILVILSATYLSYKFLEKKTLNKTVTAALIVLCAVTYFYEKKYEGKNFLSSYIVDIEINTPKLSDEYKPSTVLQEGPYTVLHTGNQNEIPHTLLIGDSHTGHYSYFVTNILKTPLYYAPMAANIGYGKILANLKSHLFIGQNDRKIFYSIYTKMLKKLVPGDTVIMANRWDVYISQYGKDYNLLDGPYDDMLNQYMTALLADFDESILKRKDLNFYIIGEGIFLDKQSLDCSHLSENISNSLLNFFLKTNKCALTKSYNLSEVNSINAKLKEYANTRDNVIFIDRNEFIKTKGGFRTIDENKKPLFMDPNHYSAYGGIYIGRKIFDSINNSLDPSNQYKY